LWQIELDKFVVVRVGETERKITKRKAFIIKLVDDDDSDPGFRSVDDPLPLSESGAAAHFWDG